MKWERVHFARYCEIVFLWCKNLLKGVCLLHLPSEYIFHVVRSNWFYALMKWKKWIWILLLCYICLFSFYSYQLWYVQMLLRGPNCWEEKWFYSVHVTQTLRMYYSCWPISWLIQEPQNPVIYICLFLGILGRVNSEVICAHPVIYIIKLSIN